VLPREAKPLEQKWLLENAAVLTDLGDMLVGSASRSSFFSAEAGTRAAAPFPAPLSPLAALLLCFASDRFLLTKPNTF